MKYRLYGVTGLGFGDESKGRVVHGLVHSFPKPQEAVVIRNNGGAQAGHHVVSADRGDHVCSQVGAGVLCGAQTILGPDFMFHPMGFIREVSSLGQNNDIRSARESVMVHQDVRILGPWNAAINQYREALRAVRSQTHGTCGMGIGDLQNDTLDGGEILRFKDLVCLNTTRLDAKIQRISEYKWEQITRLSRSHEVAPFCTRETWDNQVMKFRLALSAVKTLDVIGDHELQHVIKTAPLVVFEGAQGILLDQEFGLLQPYTTWSDTTPRSYTKLLQDTGIEDLMVLGVTRSYTTRHGMGPLPSYNGDLDKLPQYRDPHNHDHGFQGTFRVGYLDLPLLKYAVRVCTNTVSRTRFGIVVTNCDRYPGAIVSQHMVEGRSLSMSLWADQDTRRKLSPTTAQIVTTDITGALGHIADAAPVVMTTVSEIPQMVPHNI